MYEHMVRAIDYANHIAKDKILKQAILTEWFIEIYCQATSLFLMMKT
jgi:hypothetical protein